MIDIQEISKIISANMDHHSRFINEYFSFLIELVKKFEKQVCLDNPYLKESAEQLVALTLLDLNQYQALQISTRSLFSQYIKDSPLMGSPTSSLKIELSNLVKEMYSNKVWKAIALEALNARHSSRVYFDFSTVRKSEPWLSPDVLSKRRDRYNG